MLEADLSEGDLSQVTTAIQNALRPAQPHTRIVQIAPPTPGEDDGQSRVEEVDDSDIDFEEAHTTQPKPFRSGTSKKRSFPTPKVVDVDWAARPSIEDFMKEHPPKTVIDRFLAVVAWFKEAGVKDAATPDEVYTAFRKMRWPTNIKDFSQPLRDLKSDQFVTGGAKAGFAINHLGLDKVKKFAEVQ